MKLFKIALKLKRPRRGRVGAEAIVHARTKKAAEAHIEKRFTGCTIESSVELDGNVSKHFVVADLED